MWQRIFYFAKKIKLCDFPRKYDMKLNQNVTKIARMCQWLSPLLGFVKPNILCKMKTFQCVKNTFFFINTSHSTHILWYWTCLETQKCWRETYTLEHKKTNCVPKWASRTCVFGAHLKTSISPQKLKFGIGFLQKHAQNVWSETISCAQLTRKIFKKMWKQHKTPW